MSIKVKWDLINFFLGKKKRNNQENDLVRETFKELFYLRDGIVKGI